MTASILQHLLALYFAITYSWQISSSEKSIAMKKSSSIYLKDFTDFFFFIFFDKYTFTLSVKESVCCTQQPSVLLAREYLNTTLLTNFENLNSNFEHFPRNTRFLSFGALIDYLYLFKNQRQTFP